MLPFACHFCATRLLIPCLILDQVPHCQHLSSIHDTSDAHIGKYDAPGLMGNWEEDESDGGDDEYEDDDNEMMEVMTTETLRPQQDKITILLKGFEASLVTLVMMFRCRLYVYLFYEKQICMCSLLRTVYDIRLIILYCLLCCEHSPSLIQSPWSYPFCGTPPRVSSVNTS